MNDRTPPDYLEPCWDSNSYSVCHEWRRYVFEPLQAIWETFSEEQRRLIAENAQDLADREHWD